MKFNTSYYNMTVEVDYNNNVLNKLKSIKEKLESNV